MSYTTLTGLKTVEGSIKNWANNTTIPASVVLAEAEQLMFTKLRCREQQVLYTGTVASGVSALTLATVAPRFLEAISFRRAGDAAGKIYIRDKQYFEERLATDTDGTLFTGVPTECTIDATQIRFNIETDDTYYLRLWYYERPEPLSGSNETNFITDNHPRLLRHACLASAYDFLKDTGNRDFHEQMMERLIFEANAQTDIQQQAFDEDLYWDGR